ncbi:MAG: hypothetical protein GX600_00565 [Dehalococcoidia bacterium]|jgi:uncharacterized membrane protein YhaH (DUF805 family)|nr:hypothetical protein [Dehalococcoidia bacterium]
MPQREETYHLVGWTLFIICAVLFIVSSILSGDAFYLAGSIIFLIACLAFLLPLLSRRRRRDSLPDRDRGKEPGAGQ